MRFVRFKILIDFQLVKSDIKYNRFLNEVGGKHELFTMLAFVISIREFNFNPILKFNLVEIQFVLITIYCAKALPSSSPRLK